MEGPLSSFPELSCASFIALLAFFIMASCVAHNLELKENKMMELKEAEVNFEQRSTQFTNFLDLMAFTHIIIVVGACGLVANLIKVFDESRYVFFSLESLDTFCVKALELIQVIILITLEISVQTKNSCNQYKKNTCRVSVSYHN